MRKYRFREVLSVNADGSCNYGRNIVVPGKRDRYGAIRPILANAAMNPRFRTAMIPCGSAFIHVVIDPKTEEKI